eukprot:4510903-Pleurochrysis_carterae.AAC.3
MRRSQKQTTTANGAEAVEATSVGSTYENETVATASSWEWSRLSTLMCARILTVVRRDVLIAMERRGRTPSPFGAGR